MKFNCLSGLLVALLLVSTTSLKADSHLTVLKGARVVSPDGKGGVTVLKNGTVYLKGQKIQQVGDNLPVPKGAKVVDLKGKWILPGFIDAHYLSGSFTGETNEYSDAITQNFSPTVAFDPWGKGFVKLHQKGVTTIAVSPGNQNVVGGKVELIRVCPGKYPLERTAGPDLIKAAVGYEATVSGGLQRAPTSVSGAVKMLRTWVEKTFKPVGKGAKDLTKAKGKDETLITLPEPKTQAEQARLLIHIEARTQAARLLSSIEGRNVVPVLLHGSGITPEAWRLVDGYSHAVLGPLSFESSIKALSIPKELAAKKINFAFATDGDTEDLLTSAVLAMNNGLKFEEAVNSLTLNAAKIFGVDKNLGRIAKDYDADLVVWSNNPFSFKGKVESVWCLGKKVYDAPSTAKKPAKKEKK